jgi:hypothetical protein
MSRPTTRPPLAIAAIGLALAVAGCGTESPEAGSTASTTTGSSSTTTTTSPPTTSPPSTTARPTPDTTLRTPPPATDPEPVPDNPQAYAKAFVAAWVDNDKGRARQLGEEGAVKAIFSARAPDAPTFIRCEGAAGSTYCNWEGHEYTLVVRVKNQSASAGKPHAVFEATFAH